ncbi:hypothetical protein [Porphyromonas phage phage019b_ATCC49417]|uniref:Uncharacterized protein n=1 Tax=Porphyromonas phage phage019a_ATCC49417 TaxID=3154109 RepID=A0AAT9JJV6_9VIRU
MIRVFAHSALKNKIAADLGVSVQFVNRALSFRTNSRQAVAIRRIVLERGGRYSDGTPDTEAIRKKKHVSTSR